MSMNQEYVSLLNVSNPSLSTVSLCPDPERSAKRAPIDAKEIGAPQGHLHCHSLGVAPKGRGNVDDARRPLRDHPRSTVNQQQKHPQRNHRPTEARTTTELWYLSPAQHNTEVNSPSST